MSNEPVGMRTWCFVARRPSQGSRAASRAAPRRLLECRLPRRMQLLPRAPVCPPAVSARPRRRRCHRPLRQRRARVGARQRPARAAVGVRELRMLPRPKTHAPRPRLRLPLRQSTSGCRSSPCLARYPAREEHNCNCVRWAQQQAQSYAATAPTQFPVVFCFFSGTHRDSASPAKFVGGVQDSAARLVGRRVLGAAHDNYLCATGAQDLRAAWRARVH